MERIIYHGSDSIVEKPQFGVGNKSNDYGLGFYCCSNKELAKEWASKRKGAGFVNRYRIRDKILIGSNILVKRCKKENLVLIEKNKVKSNNLLYNICAVIVRIHNAGIYDALIKKDYIDYNLKCNDIFNKVSEEIWENILYILKHLFNKLMLIIFNI